MSIAALHWANSLNLKSGSKKAVLIVLADYATDTQKTYPQMATITKATSMSQGLVEKALIELVEDKIITDTGKRTGLNNDVRVFSLNTVVEIVQVPKARKGREKTPDELLDAEKVYAIYPRPIARRKTLVAIARCIKTCGFEVVFDGTKKYADAWKATGRTDKEHIPHSLTFFNQERFADDPASWGFSREALAANRGTPPRPDYVPTFASVDNFCKEKETNKDTASKWATNFYTHWQRMRWMERNKPIEWQRKLSEYINTQRQIADKKFTFDRSSISQSTDGENQPTNETEK